ncbi:MAG TPA: NAD(P)/FAD-dependent oxidoreductase, partial [Solirubrobacter sp.]
MADERFCVIGAGAAGLGTMDVLQRHGIAFDCFEQSDRVGGHWHTDYESLHLITSRDLSGFAGYPMPSDFPVYPSRDQMRSYLERFATETGVRAHVRFGVRVERMTPIGPAGRDGWSVETSDGEVRRYAGVLVCNGHLREPNLPAYPGRFTGREIHSGAYRSSADIDGTRVLTVGAGNSGCDLAVDVAGAGLRSTISMRRGQMFQPKSVFGR